MKNEYVWLAGLQQENQSSKRSTLALDSVSGMRNNEIGIDKNWAAWSSGVWYKQMLLYLLFGKKSFDSSCIRRIDSWCIYPHIIQSFTSTLHLSSLDLT
jgi:hypothetical protein